MRLIIASPSGGAVSLAVGSAGLSAACPIADGDASIEPTKQVHQTIAPSAPRIGDVRGSKRERATSDLNRQGPGQASRMTCRNANMVDDDNRDNHSRTTQYRIERRGHASPIARRHGDPGRDVFASRTPRILTRQPRRAGDKSAVADSIFTNFPSLRLSALGALKITR
ncbi:MAG: hypothetical protein AAF586_07105 [Planctomycetota bacterium]